MAHAISRLLPSQKGTHANPPTRRVKNTLSVVISIGRLQDRSFDPFRLTLISVVTTLLHTKCLITYQGLALLPRWPVQTPRERLGCHHVQRRIFSQESPDSAHRDAQSPS